MIKNNIYIDDDYALSNTNIRTTSRAINKDFNEESIIFDSFLYQYKIKYGNYSGIGRTVEPQSTIDTTPINFITLLRISSANTNPLQIQYRLDDSTLNFITLGNLGANERIVTIIYSKNNYIKVYFENTLVHQRTTNLNHPKLKLLKISPNLPRFQNKETGGYIKDIKFYYDFNVFDFDSNRNNLESIKDKLLIEWKCNQQNGTIVLDHSGNNNNGLLQGFAISETLPNGNAWKPI
jgi:hypothetical protein